MKKCTPFHLFFRLFLSKHQIKATWWKKRKEIPQRTKSNLPEHERENRGSSGSCLDVPNRRMRRQFAQTAFLSNLSMCFFKFVFTYNIFEMSLFVLVTFTEEAAEQAEDAEELGKCKSTMASPNVSSHTRVCWLGWRVVRRWFPCRNTKIHQRKSPSLSSYGVHSSVCTALVESNRAKENCFHPPPKKKELER